MRNVSFNEFAEPFVDHFPLSFWPYFVGHLLRALFPSFSLPCSLLFLLLLYLFLSVCSSILQQNWMEILAEVKTKTETATTTKYRIRLERISACGSNNFIKFSYFYLLLSSLPLNPRRKVEQTNWSEILLLFPVFRKCLQLQRGLSYRYLYIYANRMYRI